MPDEALLAATGAGELDTPAGIEAPGPADARRPPGPARRRALPPPVARHRRRACSSRPPDGRSARCSASSPGSPPARDDDVEWPAVMGPVRHSMKLETELFVERTVFDGAGTFTALMTDHQGYMSDATAPHLRRRGRARRGPRGDPDHRSRGRLHRPAQAADPLSGELSPEAAGGGADPAVGARPRRLRGPAGAHPARGAGARAARLHAPRHPPSRGRRRRCPPTP